MGINPLAVDSVCAKVMGFDYRKISTLSSSFNINKFPITDFTYEDIIVISDLEKFNKRLVDIDKEDIISFKPHFGWKGHIEVVNNE